jgi:hypothetical protein
MTYDMFFLSSRLVALRLPCHFSFHTLAQADR